MKSVFLMWPMVMTGGKVLRGAKGDKKGNTSHITKQPLLWLLRPLYSVMSNSRLKNMWVRRSPIHTQLYGRGRVYLDSVCSLTRL